MAGDSRLVTEYYLAQTYTPQNGHTPGSDNAICLDINTITSRYYVGVNGIATGTRLPSQNQLYSTNIPPTVTTTTITNVTTTTASGGGNVTSAGTASVTARGVCWSLSSNPTTSNTHTTDGTGTGIFTSSLTALTASSTYHVRAYATSSVGTSYGSDLTFVTSNTPTALPNEEQVTTVSATWSGIDMTSDGYKQVASIYNGLIYATTGYCQAWYVINNTSRAYRDIAMNSDASIIISNVTAGQIYKTTNFGTSWSAVGNTGQWNDIAISPTGQYGGVVSNDGVVNVSNDYCATWTSVTIPGTSNADAFTDITISGSYMLICSSSGTKAMYLSNNYGASGSWSQIGPVGTYPWNDLAMSGNKIVAVSSNGYTFYSDNYGSSFIQTDYQVGVVWRAVDTNGSYWIRAGASTTFNYSTDGITWSQLTNTARNWNDIVISSDGAYKTAVDSGGYIYTYNNSTCYTLATVMMNDPDIKVAYIDCSGHGTQTSTTLQVRSEVTYQGIPSCTQSGAIWSSSNSNPTFAGSYDNSITDGVGGVHVSCSYITGLSPSTLYYIRAWAVNTAGYAYSAVYTFTTLAAPTTTTTTTYPAGAGYYDCGYGCQYYSYNPGCTACSPTNSYIVSSYTCAGGCDSPLTGLNIISNITLTVGKYYWNSSFTYFYYISSTGGTGLDGPITFDTSYYTTCNNALIAYCA